MKKTQRKDALRNILKRMASYLSVCLVIVLGLGGLLITCFMAAGIEKQGDEYYRARSFKDFDMVSSAGISENNLDRIREVDKVVTVEGVLQADGSAAFDDKKRNVTIISLTEKVSIPRLVEGSIPKGRDECMIGEDFAADEKLKVGDKISLSFPKMEALGDEEALYATEFTITGLMSHPDYLRRRTINTVTIPLSAFNEEATHGYFTHAFVKIESSDVNLLSNEYLESISGTRKELEDLTKVLEKERLKEVQDEANAKIEEESVKAEKKFTEAKKKIDSAQTELDAKIAEYRKKLKDAEAQLAKAKRMLQQAKEMLPQAKEGLKEIEDRFHIETSWIPGAVKTAQELVSKYKSGVDPDDPEYQKLEKSLATTLVNHESQLRLWVKYANDPDVTGAAAEKIKSLTGLDIKPYANKIAAIPIDSIMAESRKVLNGGHYSVSMLNTIIKALRDIQSLDDLFDRIDAKITEKEKELERQEKELPIKETELNSGKRRLDEEQASAQAKIDDGKKQYDEKRKEYEKQLAEAREEVERLDCSWIVLDRAANAGYVDLRSNIQAIKSAGNAFGGLFMLITALVCFSTLVIMIDEQKKLVGTVKAFGFHKGEVFGKYLTFGVSAALVGSIVGIVLAIIVCHFIQIAYAASHMYPMGPAPTIVTPGISIIVTLVMITVTVLASVIACSGILKSPASVLMKGAVLKKSSYKKQKDKKSTRKNGSLYSRLILRNMLDDKARVLITITVIAFSCLLIGTGICMKRAYDGMTDRQVNEVYRYDLRMDINDDMDKEDRAALVKVLKEHKTSYLSATHRHYLYRWNDRLDGLQLICADPKRLGDYLAVRDPKSGKEMSIPKSGILIQRRMNESYGMNKGDTLPILDGTLKRREGKIKGYFTNYVGRMVVVSPTAYKEIFKEDAKDNCYYIKLKGADADALKRDLLAVSKDVSFEFSDEFKTKFESVSMLYNILVVLTTGISILISFMILTNMSNIFLTRKKTELTIMRVNGFSIKQTKGYLTKETIMTTAAGLILGVILGVWTAPRIIAMMQQPDLEFVKSFHPVPWLIAVGLECAFAVVINTFVFRKVKDLDLKDIA